jgi:CRP-like cAMP-binding protein
MLRRLAAEMARRLRVICARITPQQPPDAAAAPASDPLEGTTRVTPESLEALAPFKGLPSTARLALAQKLRKLSFAKDATLFRQGDPGDSVFILVEGELALQRGGRPTAKLGPGSMCGLISAVDGGPRALDCHATAGSSVLRLARDDLDWLFHSGNRFAYQIVDLVARQMVLRLRQLNATLLVQCSGLPPAAQVKTDAPQADGALARADLDLDISVWLDDG